MNLYMTSNLQTITIINICFQELIKKKLFLSFKKKTQIDWENLSLIYYVFFLLLL